MIAPCQKKEQQRLEKATATRDSLTRKNLRIAECWRNVAGHLRIMNKHQRKNEFSTHKIEEHYILLPMSRVLVSALRRIYLILSSVTIQTKTDRLLAKIQGEL